MTKDITEKQQISLTGEQRRVIKAVSSGCHIVIAPAGCGKTALLTKRVINFLKRSTGKALCVTFTDNATQEMLSRIYSHKELNNKIAARAEISTLHSLCLKFLKESLDKDKQLTIIDKRQSERYIAWSLYCSLIGKRKPKFSFDDYSEHPLDKYCRKPMVHQDYAVQIDLEQKRNLVRKTFYTAIYNLAHTYEQVKSHMGNEILLFKDFTEDSIPGVPKPYWKHIKAAAKNYNKLKKEKLFFDFDDLLCSGWELLNKDSSPKFDWIQVDEAQDLNPLQIALIKKLIRDPEKVNLVFFGDPNQSIFGFAGSSVEHFIDLVNYVTGFNGGSVEYLETNHRSSPKLIQYQRRFLRKFTQRSGGPCGIALIDGRNHKTTDKEADVKRTPQKSRFHLEACKHIKDIPSPVEIRSVKNVDIQMAEVIDCAQTSLEDFISNKYKINSNDGKHFVAILFRENSECVGYSKKMAEKGIVHYRLSDEPFRSLLPSVYKDVYDKLADTRYVKNFISLEVIKSEAQPGMQYSFRLFASHMFQEHFKKNKNITGIEDMNENERRMVFDEIFRSGITDLYSSKLLDSSIILSTVHKAKGLSFDAVIIPSVVEGNYPYKTSKHKSQLSEDARVFYVAISRAVYKLILYIPEMFGYKDYIKINRRKKKNSNGASLQTCDHNKHRRAKLVPDKILKRVSSKAIATKSRFVVIALSSGK